MLRSRAMFAIACQEPEASNLKLYPIVPTPGLFPPNSSEVWRSQQAQTQTAVETQNPKLTDYGPGYITAFTWLYSKLVPK